MSVKEAVSSKARGHVAPTASTQRASAPRHHELGNGRLPRARREQRFAEARAAMEARVTLWLEQNDPEVFFDHVSHRRRIERILELLREVNGRVLDVGPFAGIVAERLIAQGNKDVFGLDSHEGALRIAAKRGVLPVLADIEDEGVCCDDNTFDAAVMGDVLGYFVDPDFVMSEVYRVLKPGATVVLTVPNLVSLGNRLLALLGSGPYEMDIRPFGGGYQRCYTMGSLRALLKKHAFEVVSMETNFVHLPLHRLPVTRRLFGAKNGAQRHRFLYCHWAARVAPGLGEDMIVLARKGVGSAA
jgi:SAM-dependent methyltransferase